ncbi:ACT domain protein [Desulfamplus magnetovallimortis]|uniref:ACT domain protein n=1 Tax=Desulfamplus magnetovallimortis TaxID=1246637 RepID=A0A1W1HDL3_9BACT|nr:ACT domain-containing protein [Desulfamplus magnetovallimortis]SLM30468.1 ACT domain protein [Desulfamplus magnetovallimortis]
MKRREISFFLRNIPGEFGKIADLLKDRNINIESISIQDASAYVQTLFNARGKSLKRIASNGSYVSMQKDSYEFALVRLLVDKTDAAIDVMKECNYIFEITPVVAMYLPNKPGILADLTSELGRNSININYIYGSTSDKGKNCLFVISPEDIELAEAIFGNS